MQWCSGAEMKGPGVRGGGVGVVGAEVYACTICMCMCTVCMGSNAGQYRVILDRLSGLVWRNIARSIWSLIGCRPGNGHLTCNKYYDGMALCSGHWKFCRYLRIVVISAVVISEVDFGSAYYIIL